MHLLKIGDHRINADHITSILVEAPNRAGRLRIIVRSGGTGNEDNHIAVLTEEDARALLAWWDARADNVLAEYQHSR